MNKDLNNDFSHIPTLDEWQQFCNEYLYLMKYIDLRLLRKHLLKQHTPEGVKALIIQVLSDNCFNKYMK